MAKQSGIVGFYHSEEELLAACRQVRSAGYTKMDCITPFPVHGIEEAMGIQRSFLPWVTFVAGVVGGSFGLWLQWWTSAVDWPINVGGKPFFSWPAFMPVTFELTVLFAALSTVIAMFITIGLPRINPPIIDPDLTSHKFALFIPESDSKFHSGRVEEQLKSWGAQNVRRIAEF